jgi:hypothetical protein
MGVLLLTWLVPRAVSPPWTVALSVPFPGWLRWAGFALGLVTLGFWTWTQIALGKEWSPQLQLRDDPAAAATAATTKEGRSTRELGRCILELLVLAAPTACPPVESMREQGVEGDNGDQSTR